MDEDPIRAHLVAQYETVGSIEMQLLAGATFTLVECTTCGLIYHAEVPGPSLSARIYDTWIDPQRARATHRAFRDTDSRLRFAREIMLAERRLRSDADVPMKVLDFGMGWGAWCTMARAFGCDVYGHESSPERIAHAKEQAIPVLGWDEIEEHRFDLINSEQVLEHVADPHAILEHLVAALAPGGMIKLSVPDGSDAKKRLAIGNWSAMDGPENLLVLTPLQHVNCFTRRALVTLAARSGLRPAKLTLGDWFAANADRVSFGNLLGALTRPLGRRFLANDTYVFFERA